MKTNFKKLINDLARPITRPSSALWCVLLGLLLVFGLSSGFLVKNALANSLPYSNNYVNNWSISAPDGDNILISFYTKTSFCLNVAQPDALFSYNGFIDITGWTNLGVWTPTLTDNYCLTAGTTYTISGLSAQGQGDYSFTVHNLGQGLLSTGSQYFYYNIWGQAGIPYNTELANFEVVPSLTISYPANNDEIAENFYIEGSFTQPTSTYQFLDAIVTPVGNPPHIADFFQIIYGSATGTVAIWVSGLSAGYYNFEIFMLDSNGNAYPSILATISNIHIVNDLPPALPPYGEQPPSTAPPVYQPLICGTYYLSNSTYETSTALWNTICDTFSPVLLSIGTNLTDFASRFTPSNASSTGNQLGASILLVRSYITNINSFFADFPVGQFLLLYLIALVVIIVLRLVKGLINLFKI